jgi:hypothetical protein
MIIHILTILYIRNLNESKKYGFILKIINNFTKQDEIWEKKDIQNLNIVRISVKQRNYLNQND